MPGDESKYGRIVAEKKEFHDDEPVFLLRATDPLAVDTLEDYAALAEVAGCKKEFVQAVLDHADRIERWQSLNKQLVKKRPD